MKTKALTALVFLTVFAKAQDPEKIYYQLNYHPGDWITISSLRNARSIASNYRMVCVGTSGGVFRFDLNKKKILYPLTTSNGMLDNDVRVVAIDPSTENLWAATREGIQFYSPQSEWFTTAKYVQIGIGLDEEVVSIGFENAQVWLKTRKGYYISRAATSFSFIKSDPPSGVSIRWFGEELLSRTAWPGIIVHQETGYSFDDGTRSFVDAEFRKSPVTFYAYDFLGQLWIASDGAGIWRAKAVSLFAEPMNYGLAMEDVSAVSIDGLDMWIAGNLYSPMFRDYGPKQSGITLWDQEEDSFRWFDSGFRSGIKADFVTDILPDSDWIWMSTHEGLMRKSRKADYWSFYGPYSGLYHPRVFSLSKDTTMIYAGTQQGLNTIEFAGADYQIGRIELPELFNVSIYKVLPSDTGVWLGTSRGIYFLNPRTKALRQYNAYGYEVKIGALLNHEVRAITENSAAIYFVSNITVVRYDKKTREWLSIPVNTEYLAAGVNDADCDEDNLWIGTNYGALRYKNISKKWLHYSTRDGLGGNRVQAIVVDENYVWFGSEHGLTQFHWGAKHLLD